MNIDDEIEFVLKNLQKAWQCHRCDCLWIHFAHGKQDGFYRLTENPDALCDACVFIDRKIDERALITGSRWVK